MSLKKIFNLRALKRAFVAGTMLLAAPFAAVAQDAAEKPYVSTLKVELLPNDQCIVSSTIYPANKIFVTPNRILFQLDGKAASVYHNGTFESTSGHTFSDAEQYILKERRAPDIRALCKEERSKPDATITPLQTLTETVSVYKDTQVCVFNSTHGAKATVTPDEVVFETSTVDPIASAMISVYFTGRVEALTAHTIPRESLPGLRVLAKFKRSQCTQMRLR